MLLAGGLIVAAVGAVVVRGALTREATPSAQSGATTRQAQAAVVQTVPAREGAISSVFSYAGSVQAVQQVSLVPRTSGIIKELTVDVGSAVRRGQVIATLDPGSLPDQLYQARAQLAQAQARLEGLRAGRIEDIQLAAAGLDAAQAKLDLLEQGGRVESIAQSQADLDAARAKLAAVIRGATDDTRQAAVSAVESSKASVAAAELALANFTGSNVADVQAAQSTVEASRSAVTSAEIALANLPATFASDLQTAQSAYDSAATQYNSLKLTLDPQLQPMGQLGTQGTAAQLADAQAKVNQAQATLVAAQSSAASVRAAVGQSPACARDATGVLLKPDACTAAIAAADASVGVAQQALTSAQASLDQLKKAPPVSAVVQSRPQLDQAYNTMLSAQIKLESVKSKSLESQQADQQSKLDAAREKLASDQARLDALQVGGTAAQRATLLNQLVAAQEKLKSDQAKQDEIEKGSEIEDIQQAEAAVRSAEQKLLLAVSPSTEQDIRAQRAAVEQARQTLTKARLPASPADLRAAEATVEQSQAQVTAAQANLDQMVLTAPFDGVVGQRLLTVGAFAAPQTPILTLVGNAEEVHITVEEARVGLVVPGQLVQLAVPAYPGTSFDGRVTTVAPAGDPRAHTFDVTIIPEDPSGRLLPGMFAQVQVTAVQKANAVLVPRDAVVQKEDGPTVFVASDGKASSRVVQIGIQDEKNLEILSGVAADEQIVVVGQNVLRDGQPVQVPGARGQGQRP
jgi:membrane fusion protein (multidrug efflux system)